MGSVKRHYTKKIDTKQRDRAVQTVQRFLFLLLLGGGEGAGRFFDTPLLLLLAPFFFERPPLSDS